MTLLMHENKIHALEQEVKFVSIPRVIGEEKLKGYTVKESKGLYKVFISLY